MGWEKAVEHDAGLKNGLNVVNGKVVHKGVADAFRMKLSAI
jgi:alanine dehydrogenase